MPPPPMKPGARPASKSSTPVTDRLRVWRRRGPLLEGCRVPGDEGSRKVGRRPCCASCSIRNRCSARSCGRGREG
eukprot:5955265-Prymnesium_polylepis.1